MMLHLLILLLALSVVLYRRESLQVSLSVLFATLLVTSVITEFRILPWALLIAFAVPLLSLDIRREKISKHLFKLFKKVMPAMNSTEREALEAGDVWWDGDLFRGNPDWKSWLSHGSPKLSEEEQSFIDNQLETLCEMLDNWRTETELKDLSEEAWNYIKKEKFLGMIIPKSYGGLEFSALAHSTIVTKLATRCGTAAVSVMVPNSLGPAELLLHYGTEEQKNQYLPSLAIGKDIPCFALTAPDAGSDAGAMTDSGVVCKGRYQGKQVLGIKLNWNKRYITLAPVATVLGLAFNLTDPDNLLDDETEVGITVALIPTNHKGVVIGNRHIPMNASFMNGPTQGKDVFIPLDWIVGGQAYAGKGWMMLMESLAAGRAISLPGMGAASGAMSYRMTGAYARVREQFNTSISNFEGVEEAMAQIAGRAYMLEASRVATASAVDLGLKPSVVSAIAKYHMTEEGRVAIRHAMDVHGGRGLILGENNYLASGYMSAPIGITVEGANILTRNLMIFGQGAIRCHPYVFNEMQAVNNADEEEGLKQFDENLFGHIGYAMSNFVRTIGMGLTGAHFTPKPVSGETAHYYQQLTRMSSALALVSDVAMGVLGGDLKRKERLSARLGDVLSQLYLASTVLRYYQDGGANEQELPYVHWNLQRCLFLIQQAFLDFFRNFPVKSLGLMLKWMVFPLGARFKQPDDNLDHLMVKTMVAKSAIRERLTEICYVGKSAQDPTGKIELAFEKVLLSANAERKLRKAVKAKKISELPTLEETLEEAITKGILNSEEVRLISEASEARWDAIQVDDYDPEFVKNPVKFMEKKRKLKTAKKKPTKQKVVREAAA